MASLAVVVAVAAAAVLLAAVPPAPRLAAGQQVAAACSESLVTSFTPCLAFISNGSRNGTFGPPTADCCRGLAVVVNVSTSCAQLILAGQVVLGIQVNCTLAVALPKACNSTISFAVQCKDSPTAQINSPPRGPATSPSPPATPPATLPPTTSPKSPSPSPAPAPGPGPASNGPIGSSAWRRGGVGGGAAVSALAAVLGVAAMMA